MSTKSKSLNPKVGVHLPDDLQDWFEETRLYEDRRRGNMVIQLLREAKANREAHAHDVPADTKPGAANRLTLEQAKAQGLINGR